MAQLTIQMTCEARVAHAGRALCTDGRYHRNFNSIPILFRSPSVDYDT